MIELISRKDIFHARLNGEPIVLDYRDTSVEQRQHAARLLWETGVFQLLKPDFFDRAENKNDYARALYKHPVLLYTDDGPHHPERHLYEIGDHFGITYGAYKLLKVGEGA